MKTYFEIKASKLDEGADEKFKVTFRQGEISSDGFVTYVNQEDDQFTLVGYFDKEGIFSSVENGLSYE